MAKPRKKADAAEAPIEPHIGDKVTVPRSKSVLEINHVHHGGDEVDLQLPGTNLEWFRVKADTLTFVERKPPARTSNPFTEPEPTFDAGRVMERVSTVQRENLQRLDDDIAILSKYLKTEGVPKAAISILEGMSNEQQVGRRQTTGSRSC
jgi:hypothetical protein